MQARLVPVYFKQGRDSDFDRQLEALRGLLGEEAALLDPVGLGGPLPEADAAVFPQMLGEAYRQVEEIRRIPLPRLVITSEFGTMAMWDWEIASYLRAEGIETMAPYTLEQARSIVRALAVKRELRQTKFLVFQDNPGEGFQAGIFKRFYWWEEECTRRILEKFGLTIVRKSFRELGERARQIPDERASAALDGRDLPMPGVSERARRSALKLYLAVRDELDGDPGIRGVGINCLNESHVSDTTPCLAWNLLYEERELIWGCEADTLSMLTKYVLHRSLKVPIMMSNLYPFLMGQAALKHERVDAFPPVQGDPANYVLVAHCGYLGVLPRPFAAEWSLKPKVLAIVDENATAIDARLPTGPVTLAKLSPGLRAITVIEGELEGYAQYPGSDCRNGGVIRVPDGRRLMKSLSSHHYLILTGRQRAAIDFAAQVFGLEVEVL